MSAGRMFQRLAGAGKSILRGPVRSLRRRLNSSAVPPSALVLAYHRVYSPASDPHGICVSPENFREHVRFLTRKLDVVPLSDMVRFLKQGIVRQNTIAITFDDGYRDNLTHAKEILEEFGAPATLFAVAGEIGRNRRFWWDELSRLVLAPANLPDSLTVNLPGSTRRWERKGANGSERWSAAGGTTAPGSRVDLHGWLHTSIRPLPDAHRWIVLRELKEWGAVGEDDPSEHRAMTGEELRQFELGGRQEVGLHTLTHPVLSSLSSLEQKAEIFEGKAVLERLLGHPVRSFAYPFGARCDFTPETIHWLKDAGLESACTFYDGAVTPATNPFEIPRLDVGNWGVDEFARNVKRCLS